jgi:hypothetical protein
MYRPSAGEILLFLGVFASVGLTGCAPTGALEAQRSRGGTDATAEMNVPPKELLESVKRILAAPPISLEIADQAKGTVTTGWKRYRGDWHIARHWQERTRYHIEVLPDWDEPMARAKLRVTAETEQRAAAGQRWDRESRVQRPERARAVLEQLTQQLRQSAQIEP